MRSASFEGTQRACSVCRPDRLAQQINDQDALFSRISDLQDQGILSTGPLPIGGCLKSTAEASRVILLSRSQKLLLHHQQHLPEQHRPPVPRVAPLVLPRPPHRRLWM